MAKAEACQELPGDTPAEVREVLIDVARRSRAMGPGARLACTRATRAILRLVDVAQDDDLLRVGGAPTDLGVLVGALQQREVLSLYRRLDNLLEGDPPELAEAAFRGIARQDELLNAEGGALTAPQAARLLGMTRQGVDERRRHGRLLGLSAGRKGYLYPAWQLDPDGPGRVLPGLESVLRALEDVDDWMRLAFFLEPQRRLGECTPLQYLRRARDLTAAERQHVLGAVLRAAQAYGEQGGD